MITVHFPVEWAIRSSILILSGGLLLWVLRVKDPARRLAAWTAMLFGSLAIPALTPALPKAPTMLTRVESSLIGADSTSAPVGRALYPDVQVAIQGSRTIDWTRAAAVIYVAGVFALLIRLCVGLAMSLRLLRAARVTDREIGTILVRESDRVIAPVTLGILRPVIVLPADWREWQASKLDAVLAHERSHITRHDPAVQVISAIHRALLWHSPLSWFLHRRIVRVAEEASDDAALTVVEDRTFYAEVLLDFMRRGVRAPGWGVPMAKYGRAERRIQRILDGAPLSNGMTSRGVAVVLALGSPLAYLAAAAYPQTATRTPTAAVLAPTAPAVEAGPAARSTAPKIAQATAPVTRRPSPVYVDGLGTAIPSSLVTIRPRVDGQLLSVAFKEGDEVQPGQLLASIDPRPYEIQLAQAVSQFALNKDQGTVDRAQLQLSYTQIHAPGPGVAGLLMVDPGNFVRAGDPIVVITQMHPAAVVFTIPEDWLPDVLARQRERADVTVEAWNRDNTRKLGTGRLTAVDNLIDTASGTTKLKAAFENQDGALYPNQFVNVRMLMSSQ